MPNRVPDFLLPEMGVKDRLQALLQDIKDFLNEPTNFTKSKSADPLWQQFESLRPKPHLSRISSLIIHMVLILLALITPTIFKQNKPETKKLDGDAIDISAYLPPSLRKSAGGGGGGTRDSKPPSKVKLPKKALRQLTPPPAVIRNPYPRLAVDPTIVVPPEFNTQHLEMKEPLSVSGGPGAQGGIGQGAEGGIGPGFGPGIGPGWGGGAGGGAFKVGGSVSAPICIFCPDPEYSEEARKAKYQGVVVLFVIIDEKGQVIPQSIQVEKKLGMGLDEAAVRAVQQWRFRPSERFGKPVPVQFLVEVRFQLL